MVIVKEVSDRVEVQFNIGIAELKHLIMSNLTNQASLLEINTTIQTLEAKLNTGITELKNLIMSNFTNQNNVSSSVKGECDASDIAFDDSIFLERPCVGDDRDFSSLSLKSDPVFFFCIRSQNNQHHWYSVDPYIFPDPTKLNHHYQEQTVNRWFKMPDDYGRAFSSVAVDSKIYFVCDYPTPNPNGPWIDLMIKKLDTKTDEWTSYPRLPIFQRPKPAMVAQDGLLYILGTRDMGRFFPKQDDMYEPIATVFDTRGVSGGFEDWNTLFTDQSGCVRANAQVNCAIDHNYIVAVISSKFAYICDLKCKSLTSFWGPPIALHLPGELNPPGSRNILLLNGEIIMYVYPSLLAGSLDSLRNGHWEYTRVSGDFEDYTKSATPDGHVFLFDNGGGDFYFLWSPKPVPNECEDEPKTKVHCLRFHIAIPYGGNGWSTSVRETTVYTTECDGGDLVDCVHML